MNETSIFDYLRAAREARNLSKCAKSVLFGLIAYLDGRTGNAWPSVKTLQTATGWSRRAVQKGIDELARAGVVEIIGGRAGGVGPNGRGISNRFIVKLSVLIALGAPGAPMKGARGDREVRNGLLSSAHPALRQGAPGAPKADTEREKAKWSESTLSLGSASGSQTKAGPASDGWNLDAVFGEEMIR